MSKWLGAVASSSFVSTKNGHDFSAVAEAVSNAIDHFDSLYNEMRKHLEVRGLRVVDVAANIAGLAETVAASWSELKAISDILELKLRTIEGIRRSHYHNHYQKALSDRLIELYTKSDPEVIQVSEFITLIDFRVNMWESLSKGVSNLSYNIKLIGDMRQAGMMDATI